MLRLSKLTIAAAFLCLSTVAVAAPVVTGLGTSIFDHGTSATISVTNPGTKSTVPPHIWDNMETGGFHPNWGGVSVARINTSDARHGNSAYNGNHNFQGSGGDGYYGAFEAPSDTRSATWFCQYWFKLDTNWNWGAGPAGSADANLANVKMFRLWHAGGQENLSFASWRNGLMQYSMELIEPPQQQRDFYSRSNFTPGVWQCFQFEFISSDIGVANGTFRWWHNGYRVVNNTTFMTRQNLATYKYPLILGFFNSWIDGGTDRDDFYIDDVYIDTSLARVEVGDNVDYNSCTHREVQIPTAWANDEISFTVNTGSFDGEADAYIFVVDENGVKSAGFPIVVGQSGGGLVEGPGDITDPPTDITATGGN